MKNAQRFITLAVVSVLLTACGGGDEESSAAASSKLPEDTCAQLALGQVIEGAFGKPELATDKADGNSAHCVWIAPPSDRSASGATVEVTITTGTGSDLDDAWSTATGQSVAPGDWVPATSVKSTKATPKGDWETADGVDFHLFVSPNTTRQLSFRNGQGTNYVAHAAVAMDVKGRQASAEVASVADAALAAVPSLLD